MRCANKKRMRAGGLRIRNVEVEYISLMEKWKSRFLQDKKAFWGFT